ncbi:YraN family protein [Paracoccus sp. DMF-8]|uniref:YraN family protein n=1 Tax=Paracoccus sp. DMF-8 TaxID=3019445 RepID=UPI0023E39F5E|nr:YraN family protein [Paracoccus sp. DMF-8]MDF3608503.1 YraN family protein [Paracoccus sp. DMF-8]
MINQGPAQNPAQNPAQTQRRWNGALGHAAGKLAEEAVVRHYRDMGLVLLATRWCGAWGEIDLIFRDGHMIVFVEVKKARDHDAAAARLSRRQMERICITAQDFMAGMPDGNDTPMRFDAALVDRDGNIRIIRGAFGQG